MSMEPRSLAWLVAWFARRGSVPDDNLNDVNYFDQGLIDSFMVIELIDDAEQAFDVRFTESHFQDRRFATIGGLASIIDSLQSNPA